MPGLADGLAGDGSIQTLDAAAPWRLADARVLDREGRRTAAVYLYGYVAEIRLTAACYRLTGHAPEQTIGRGTREGLERDARRQNIMSSDPHDLLGWARLLLILRKRDRIGYDREFGIEMVSRVADLYGNWRPRLRYRAIYPTAAQLTLVRDAAEWLDNNYPRLWS